MQNRDRSISPFSPKDSSFGLERESKKRKGVETDNERGYQQWASQIGKVPQIISWKSDPKASFSDWKLEIKSLDGGDLEIYHVHRNIVGFGPRKSDFFRREFMDQDSKVTQLDIPEDQIKVFPMILDYMYYSREVKVKKLTADLASSMFKLSEFLGVETLKKGLVDFYRKNVTLQNVEEYIECAKIKGADDLVEVSKSTIGGVIVNKPSLAGLVSPNFLMDIIEYYRKQSEDIKERQPEIYSRREELIQSLHMSKVAYACASHNQSVMTKDLFEKLTDERALPAIDVSVALPFLLMSVTFGDGTTTYTSLQQRCVKRITNDWEAFQRGFSSQEKATESLRKLPSHILADILVTTMNR